MKFGLKVQTLVQINDVFFRYLQVEKVVLYGSRAKGNFKNGSDIDLCLEGEGLNLSILHQIDNDLDDLLLPYTFDLSIFKQIDNTDLIAHIQKVGLVFYEARRSFRLTKEISDAMIAHAEADTPNECCGLLAGKEGLATEIYPIQNLPSDDPAVKDMKVPPDRRVRYVMDPKEQIASFKKMRENDTEMMAIYHSHTASPAYPSSTDIRLAYYPDVHYLIISLEKSDAPYIRAFKIIDEKVTEDEIKTLS